jgi:hypothetical protein
MEAIETFKVDDKKVEIHIDEDPSNPRDFDNCDLFILFHKRYNLGDKHDYKHEDFSGWDEMEAQIIKDHDPVVIKSVYLMDHSGISISDKPFSCHFDSGMIGFALISRKSALKEMNAKRVTRKVKEWAKKCLDSSIKTYDEYLKGEVYGYVIKDEEDNDLESCWGFFGLDYVKKEATELAKGIIVPPKPEVKDPNQLELALNNA